MMATTLRSYDTLHEIAHDIVQDIRVENLQRWLPQESYRAQFNAYMEQILSTSSPEIDTLTKNLCKDFFSLEEGFQERLYKDLIQPDSSIHLPSMHRDGPYLEEIINKRLNAKAMAMKIARPINIAVGNAATEAVQVPKLIPITLNDIITPKLRYDLKESMLHENSRFYAGMLNLVQQVRTDDLIKQLQDSLSILRSDTALMTSLNPRSQCLDIHRRNKPLTRIAGQFTFVRPGKAPIARQDLHEYYYGNDKKSVKRKRSTSPITAPSRIIFIGRANFLSRKDVTIENSKNALNVFFLPNLIRKLSSPDGQWLSSSSEQGQKWILEQDKMSENGLDRAKRYRRMLDKLCRRDEGVWAQMPLYKHLPEPDFLSEDYSHLCLDVQWRCQPADAEAIKLQKKRCDEIRENSEWNQKQKSLSIVFEPDLLFTHARIVDDSNSQECEESLPKTPEQTTEVVGMQILLGRDAETLPEAPPIAMSSESDPKDSSGQRSDVFAEL